LEGLYHTIKPGGLLLFSDYYFDGTHETPFWYSPVRLSHGSSRYHSDVTVTGFSRLRVLH